MLAETTAALEEMTVAKEKCEVDLNECNIAAQELSEQLATCIVMVEAEKKAREELLKTIMEVKAGAEKVSGEYAFLPFL